MSVFGDFQRVWVQRFPDSTLPAAWEEDVRANLVKHKQKVSQNSLEVTLRSFCNNSIFLSLNNSDLSTGRSA